MSIQTSVKSSDTQQGAQVLMHFRYMNYMDESLFNNKLKHRNILLNIILWLYFPIQCWEVKI